MFKYLSFQVFMLFSEIEKEDQLLNSVLQSRNQALEMIKISQQQIILVASLLDRIPNLAGLARTCEVSFTYRGPLGLNFH